MKDRKVVVRIFTFYEITKYQLLNLFPSNFSVDGSEVEILVNESGDCDLAVVLGFARPGMWVNCASSSLIKVISEPWQKGIFYRFVRKHDRRFSAIFTPHVQIDADARVRKIAGNVDWHVSRSWAELISIEAPKKTKMISAIISRKTALPGHKNRLEILAQFQRQYPDLLRFGRGTPHPLEKKEDGLSSFMYSLAIENSIQTNYFTEKLFDCFLEWCVPIYLGAPNIADYFPEGSYIDLQGAVDGGQLNLSKLDMKLGQEDYLARLASLEKARHLVLTKYTLSSHLRQWILDFVSTTIVRRRLRLDTFDSYLHHFRDQAFRLLSSLRGN